MTRLGCSLLRGSRAPCWEHQGEAGGEAVSVIQSKQPDPQHPWGDTGTAMLLSQPLIGLIEVQVPSG